MTIQVTIIDTLLVFVDKNCHLRRQNKILTKKYRFVRIENAMF